MKKMRLKEVEKQPLPDSNYNFANMIVGVTYEVPVNGDALKKRKSLSVTKTRYVKKANELGYDIDFQVWRVSRKVFIRRLK